MHYSSCYMNEPAPLSSPSSAFFADLRITFPASGMCAVYSLPSFDTPRGQTITTPVFEQCFHFTVGDTCSHVSCQHLSCNLKTCPSSKAISFSGLPNFKLVWG